MNRFLPVVRRQVEVIENYKFLLFSMIVFSLIMFITFSHFNLNRKINKLSIIIIKQHTKVKSLTAISEIMSQKIIKMNKQYVSLRNNIEKDNIYQVKVTYYVPHIGGINSDSQPDKTATMKKPIPGYTIALSSELVHAGWLGQKIYIDGLGVFHATDRMSKSIPGKHIDICVGDLKTAMKLTPNHPMIAIRLIDEKELI